MSYWLNLALFGEKEADKIWNMEMARDTIIFLIIGFVGLLGAAIYSIYYVSSWIWKQVALELNYYQKYGTSWQAEYERYHGSLAKAHFRLVIVVLCLLALSVVLLWISRQVYKRRKKRIQNNAT